MATTADYVGKNCPFCGAVDSIDTDEARGEVACVNCATVVAMGLEENVATRFEKDATFADVDRDEGWNPETDGGPLGHASKQNAGLTRAEAAAAAAGLLRRPSSLPSTAGGSGESFDAAKYAKTKLHPRMTGQLETLFRLSRRRDDAILQEAVSLAKCFVGYRRERSVRVEHQTEVAAACLMLAAELHGQPIPLAEMRVLDGTLRDVESRRQEIIDDTRLRSSMAAVEKKFVPNLVHYYMQLLKLPFNHYEKPCLALVEALRACEATHDPGTSELATLVEAEKVLMAALLVGTEPRLRWRHKPTTVATAAPGSPEGPSRTTLLYSFASRAHIPPARVEKVMRIAEKLWPLLQPHFERLVDSPGCGSAPAPPTPTSATTGIECPAKNTTPQTQQANSTFATGLSSTSPTTHKRPRSPTDPGPRPK